jgi:hypothetical protein
MQIIYIFFAFLQHFISIMQRAIVNAPASARKLAFATRCSAPAPAPKVTGPERNKETRMQVNLLPGKTMRDGVGHSPPHTLLTSCQRLLHFTSSSSILYSAVAPALMIGGVNPAYEFLKGQADTFSTLGLPEWLIHWGHPGNMFVVLLAMGGYGGWLGWQIRLSDDDDLITKAKDMHPKVCSF